MKTFSVGHLTLVDTVGPTQPVNIETATIRRDPTIDFIYKIDSALRNDLDSIQLYNGQFSIKQTTRINDSIRVHLVEAKTLTDWRKATSKVRKNRYRVYSLNQEVIRFDYLDGHTVYELVDKKSTSDLRSQKTYSESIALIEEYQSSEK